MTPKPDLLDELAPLFPPPEMPYEKVLRRRGRKQRNQRTVAAVLGLAIFAIGVLAFASSILSRSDETPGGTPAPSAVADGFANVRGWVAYRNGSNIVAVDPANPDATLVLGTCVDADPIGWSADGTRLLLRSGPLNQAEPGLFVMASDGSCQSVDGVTWSREGPPASGATWGSFSPDGSEIAFARNGHYRGPYIIDADGGIPRSIGECVDRCGEPIRESAAWSPDGSRIAWTDFVEDSPLYGHHASTLSFVNADGSGVQTEVVELPGGETKWSLVWSPDGSQLAFWGDFEDLTHPAQPGQIFVINADGSGLRQITYEGDNRWPAWSPDSSRIAFVHDGVLATMAADGSDMQEVTGIEPFEAIAWNPVA
jgi:Tol biopolymer transport system component